MKTRHFAVIIGIQLIGALIIAGVLLSDQLNAVASLMFLAIIMTIITITTMSAIAYILGPRHQAKIDKSHQPKS